MCFKYLSLSLFVSVEDRLAPVQMNMTLGVENQQPKFKEAEAQRDI